MKLGIYLFSILTFVFCGNLNQLENDGIFLDLLNNVFIEEMKAEGVNAVIFLRNIAIIVNAAYDAFTAYDPKSVGIYSKIPKQQEKERTLRNKNIAIAYAMLRTGLVQLPKTRTKLENLFQSLGLDIQATTLDLNSPIGVGNYAAKQVLKVRLNDGMNQLGNLNGKKYNRRPYEDYTNYQPKDTAYELKYPGRWQPDIVLARRDGIYFVQQATYPQMRLVKPYLLDVNKYKSPVPTASNPANKAAYKQQVDEILKLSSELNDYTKMVAEHFDNEIESVPPPLMYLIKKNNLNQDEIIKLFFLVFMSTFDALIITSQEKYRYDTVRPFSAVRYLYNNTAFRAWGGPGVGIVNDITGREWRPYLQTAPIPEYPSGAASVCGTFFTVLENYFKSSDFGYSVIKPKGSSVIEPNITPSSDITLGPFKTYDDYINECALARQLGGVHFKAGANEGRELGKRIGKDAYSAGIKYLNGIVNQKTYHEI